jgi:AraC-like DNA-binding protein
MFYDAQQYPKKHSALCWRSSSEFYTELSCYNLQEMPCCFQFKHEQTEMATLAFEPLIGYRLGVCCPAPVRSECNMTFRCDLQLIFFILVLEGSYHLDFGEESDISVDLEKNNFVVALCGNTVIHSLLKKQDNYCSICLALNPACIASYFGTTVSDSLLCTLRKQEKEGEVPYPMFTGLASPELQSLGRMIIRSGKTDFVSVANLRVASLGLFSKMLQIVCYREKTKQSTIYDDDMTIITRMKNMIELDVIKNRDAREVCRKVGITFTRANNLFRVLYGLTIHRFIHNCMMNHAYTLMQVKECTVSECAFEVGYSNIGHFIGAFKKQFNCTPGDILRDKR